MVALQILAESRTVPSPAEARPTAAFKWNFVQPDKHTRLATHWTAGQGQGSSLLPAAGPGVLPSLLKEPRKRAGGVRVGARGEQMDEARDLKCADYGMHW